MPISKVISQHNLTPNTSFIDVEIIIEEYDENDALISSTKKKRFIIKKQNLDFVYNADTDTASKNIDIFDGNTLVCSIGHDETGHAVNSNYYDGGNDPGAILDSIKIYLNS